MKNVNDKTNKNKLERHQKIQKKKNTDETKGKKEQRETENRQQISDQNLFWIFFCGGKSIFGGRLEGTPTRAKNKREKVKKRRWESNEKMNKKTK